MMRLKVLSMFLVVALLLTCCLDTKFVTNVMADEGEPTISISNVYGAPGDEVTVALNVENNPGICYFYVFLNYDDGLSLVSVENTRVFDNPLHSGNLAFNPYVLSYDMSLDFNGNTNDGTVAYLNFKIDENIADGDYAIWITYSWGNIFDTNFNDVTFKSVPGVITVDSNDDSCHHVYRNYMSDNNATCLDDGTKTAFCDNGCGARITVVEADSQLSHMFSNYTSDNNATCLDDGTKTAFCDNGCGATNTVVETDSQLSHTFSNYISDNNATCMSYGTMTAVCDNGCGVTDTVVDENGGYSSHKFTNYIGNGNGIITADCDFGCGVTDTIEGYPRLVLNEKKNVEITEEKKEGYFFFTPEEDGYYSFYSISDADTYGYILDSDMNGLAANDDNGDGYNFKVELQLTAGQNYILKAEYLDYYATGTFDVCVEKAKKVVSIEVISGEIVPVVEDMDGYWSDRYNEDTGEWEEYFRYYWEFSEDLIIQINYSDGTSTTAGLYDEVDGYWFDYDTNQESVPWLLGNDNYLTIQYLGATTKLPVTVTENPVDHIKIDTAPTREYVYGDVTQYDGRIVGEGSEGNYYLNPTDLTGLVFTVYYKDGTSKTYSYDDIEDRYFIDGYEYSLNYSYDAVTPGNVPVSFNYMGKSAEYTVVLKESPVKDVRVLNNITCYSGYSSPLFYGMQLEILYNDGTSKVVTLTEENTTHDYDGYYELHIETAIDGYTFRISQYWSEDGKYFMGQYLGQDIEVENNIIYEEDKEITSVNLENIYETGIGMNVNVTYADGTQEIFTVDNLLHTVCYGEYYTETEKGLLWYYIEYMNVTDEENPDITGKYVVEIFDQVIDIPEYTDATGKYRYTLSRENKATIMGCTAEPIGAITIPAIVDGYPVEAIGTYAFYECTELTSVVIPDGVSQIGLGAFLLCTQLQSVNLPAGMNCIDKWAFEDCTALINMEIPDGVTTIKYGAFMDCTSLVNIEIPDSVTTIGEYTFQNCIALKSVQLPTGIAELPRGLFYNCSGLISVIIPEGVTKIGAYAFRGCEQLTNVTIPDSVSYIDNYAFAHCMGIERINIPGNITYIGEGAFCYAGLKTIEIPDGIVAIDDYTFYECSALTNITIPKSVTEIGESAFYLCDNLNTVYYGGLQEEWEQIVIDDVENECLLSAELVCRSVANLEYDVKVDTSDYEFDFDTILHVELKDTSDIAIKEFENFDVKNAVIYDIYLAKDDVVVQPSGLVTVSIPVPADMNGDLCNVFYVDKDGNLMDMNAQFIDGYLVFQTDHFSYYAIMEERNMLIGDVNSDGTVNAKDVASLRRFLAGGWDVTIDEVAADVNGDGAINAKDVATLRRYLAGGWGIVMG